MSFDVYLEVPRCDHCKREAESVWDFNLTHNVNEIVNACLMAAGGPVAKDGKYYRERSWGRLQGWTGADAAPILAKALAVSEEPERQASFRAMQPSNGWGRLEDVQRVLRQFVEACQEHPAAVIRVSG